MKNVIKELKKFKCNLDFYDPWVDKNEFNQKYSDYPKSKLIENTYDAVILSVAHSKFKKLGIKKIKKLCKKNHVFFDLKNIFKSDQVDFKL